MKPVVLDLYCKAGGMARGLQRAGFRVIGIDHEAQPNYAGDLFIQVDALEALRILLAGGEIAGLRLNGFAGVHASPPCQRHSDLQRRTGRVYPELIAPTRELLVQTGLPWVIENVEGAPLWPRSTITLCGVAFSGLRVIRHRLFETNWGLEGDNCPGVKNHPLVFTHDKRKSHYGQLDQDTSYVQVTGGGNCTIANAKDAMGIDWPMTKAEVNEAIPPAYGEHVGKQLMACLQSREALPDAA